MAENATQESPLLDWKDWQSTGTFSNPLERFIGLTHAQRPCDVSAVFKTLRGQSVQLPLPYVQYYIDDLDQRLRPGLFNIKPNADMRRLIEGRKSVAEEALLAFDVCQQPRPGQPVQTYQMATAPDPRLRPDAGELAAQALERIRQRRYDPVPVATRELRRISEESLLNAGRARDDLHLFLKATTDYAMQALDKRNASLAKARAAKATKRNANGGPA